MSAKVQFARGPEIRYDSIEDKSGLLYFCTDTGIIKLNNVTYGISPDDTAKLNNSIKNINIQDGTLIFLNNSDEEFSINLQVPTITLITLEDGYNETTADVYKITYGNEEENFQLRYTPTSNDNLQVPETIGDIERGTTAASLKGKPISKILDDIIFKTIYPTVYRPSATLSITNVSNIIDIGLANPVKRPKSNTFTVNYNLGSCGAYTNIVYIENFQPGTETSELPYTGSYRDDVTDFKIGTYTITATVSYAKGSVLLDSKGNKPNPIRTSNLGYVENPLPAGSILSNSIVIKVSASIKTGYKNEGDQFSYRTHSALEWGKPMTLTDITWDSITPGNMIIKSPRKLKLFYSYNLVSGNYDVLITEFDASGNLSRDVFTYTVENGTVKYHCYTWKGAALDSNKYKIITY